MHPPEFTAHFSLPDEEATVLLGAKLAPFLAPGLVIYLEGDLGAGKTTLARALLRALGHAGPVKSPSYSLVEIYVVSSLYCYHFDFYRFESPEEFVDAGLGEYFHGDAVCLVEWPDKAAGYVSPADLCFRFSGAANGRQVEGLARSERGARCLRNLSRAWQEDGCFPLPEPPFSSP
ncbi:MAG: tRNA threonylcarbamoyladenosine biosynthesis protein TsaE [Betaproteobacteria bacterium ADurb.Bin341]|nr:MAG: tRNA threonylcarbamoyladenosine biosynthesis protein TsaE [Betaproteobacteria bacterium ADurb.Bin341]